MHLPQSRKLFPVLLFFIAVTILYWLLPISGQILLVREGWQQEHTWPQVRLQGAGLRPGEAATVVISDPTPWSYVKLFAAGREATLQGYEVGGPESVWQWTYTFPTPEESGYELAFYHSCDSGCRPWTTVTVGSTSNLQERLRLPTKLGVVFPNPARDWHGRQGWVVELTYATQADEEYWGIDDLASRVQAAARQGLLVLVRIDYAPQQSIPPAGDILALDHYLGYVRRLARDARLQGAYGYIIGSGFNTAGSNTLAPERPVTAEWYARVFNGYDTEPERVDNVSAVVRVESPAARVLVGPVTPESVDQSGRLIYEVDAPWLNYMNTLVASLNTAAHDRAIAGSPLMAPDGFAVQAPGRPELVEGDKALEPRLTLTLPTWPGAQTGFRVYEHWQAIINDYPYSAGRPLYISATNTYHPAEGIMPAENYPAGWLTTALDVVNAEPQVAALIWFIDSFPHDEQWDFFSLTEARGQMATAAEEFEHLLQPAP